MHFRKAILCLFILTSTALVLSCANDYDFEEEVLNINLSFNTNCIDQIQTFFENYSNEESSEAEIRQNILCMFDAVDYVKFRVAGEKQERYQIVEIKSFFNKFVFSENPKEDEFFKSALKIKKEIFGGSENYLTFKELSLLQGMLLRLESTMLELEPYAKEVFFQERYLDLSSVKFARKHLFGFLEEVLSYDLKTFSILDIVNNLKIFIDLDESLNDWLEVFNLLRGEERSNFIVLKDNQSKILEAASEYYELYASLVFNLNKEWSTKREDFEDLSVEIIKFFDLLTESIQNKQVQSWDKKDLLHVFGLLKTNFLEDLSDETLSLLVDVLFVKWFPSDNNIAELNVENLNSILKEFRSVLFFLKESVKIEGFVGEKFPVVETDSQLLSQLLNLRWPSMITKEKSFIIDVSPTDQEFSFQALLQWSWSFVVAEIFVRTYAKDFKGMSIEQVAEAYLDVFPLLVDMDILGEESRSSWFRIFNEGDLLVPSANPNGFVSNSEMSEYISFMFSAYFSGVEAANETKTFCPDLSKDCFFKIMKKPEVDLFRTMPSLNNFLGANIEVESFDLWSESMEYIAKLDVNDDDYTQNMFFRASVGNQYVEVLFRRYDLDKSGTFNFKETEKAYDDFKFALRLLPQVKGTVAENSDFFLKAFFTYFVDNGRLPEFNNGFPEGRFFAYMLRCGFFEFNSCSFESDRSSILAILAYLTSVELVE